MGRLDRLELHNFKSYGGDVIIGPFKPFTAIIGTNGSGKSNVMDAISFVLGVRTAQLRGNQLRDLVYRNLDDPSDDSSRRKAHVKLVYRKREDPVDEIEFMRSVTLQGASEYRVQGRVVSLEGYNSQLASIGVLVKARNFLVFQNEVESIASKNPKELTAMFEEVSESAEYRQKYDDARVEKDEAEDAVTHFWRKRKGIAAEKRQYKEQKEEADKYSRLQNQIADLKTEMALFELFHVDEDLRAKNTEVIDLNDEVEEKERQLFTKESALGNERQTIQKLDGEKMKLERKRKRFLDEIEKLHPLQVKCDTEKSSLIRRNKGDEKHIEKFQEELLKGEDQVKQLEQQLKDIQLEIENVDKEIKEAEEANVSAQSMAQYRSLKDRLDTRTSTLQQELNVAIRDFKGTENDKNALELREQDLRNRVTNSSKKSNDYRATAADLLNRLKQASESLNQLKHEREQMTEVSQERDNIRQNLEKTLHDTTQALRDAKADMTQSTREESFNRAFERMQSLFPGVHGRLSDLCQPTQAKYREAIAVIFGKMIDAIVVDNSNTGKQCIEYLKDQRVGIATFIPLAEIRARPVDESLRRLGGTSRLAIDVLKYRDFIHKAVLYAAGSAVVCDTLDEARYLRYDGGQKIKICSLDGTLINKAGFMTGGTSRGEMNRARKWDRGEIETLKRKRQNAIHELENLGASDNDRRNASEIMERIEAHNRDIALMENDRKDYLARATNCDRDGKQSARELDQIIPQIETARKEFQAAKSKMESVQEQLNGVEIEIFGDFIGKHNVDSVKQFESLFVGQADKIKEKKLELETKESKISTSLNFQKSQRGNSSFKKIEKRIQMRKERLEELENEIKDMSVKKTELESRASEIVKEIEDIVEKKQECMGSINEKRQDFKKESDSVTESKKLLEDKKSKRDQLLDTRKRLLTAAKVAQVRIPIREDDSDDESTSYRSGSASGRRRSRQRRRSSNSGSQVDNEGDTVMGEGAGGTGGSTPAGASGTGGGTDDANNQESVEVDVNIMIDYSVLSRRHRAAATLSKQKEMMESYEEKIKTMEQQLDGLAPNMKANEHMSDVAERLNEMDREAETARDRARRAVSAFEDVKQKRQDRFSDCFNHVAAKINEVYKELTKSNTYPMGGTAYLSLEQQDEPYLSGIKFNTMPPTKRFRDMEQLSGGERTVAALALLFAIHDFRPSPFFVLDEVDAALDNLNVGRVSRYIKSRAPGLQTIVISLKDTFFERADALVGIFRDVDLKASRLLTLDLTQYPEDDASGPSHTPSVTASASASS